MKFLKRFFGGEEESEQSKAFGNTRRPENSQSTGPAEPDLGEAGRGKGPAREKEIEIEWDPEQGCLEVETKQDLELGLSKFMFELSEGEVHVVGTDKVQQPELTITERIYADSEPEAINYQKDSFVGVSADWDSLLVIGKNSLGVVSGGSGNVPTVGGSSQSAPRRETQVVLKVPVAKNLDEGKAPEPERAYFITVDSGHIGVENGTGRYTISAGSGNVVIKGCRMMAGSKIETGSGGIKVTGTTFNSCRIETGSGGIEVTGTTFNLCTIETGSGNVGVTGILDSFIIITGSGNVGVTGIFTGKNTVKTGAGNILVKFGRGQGEIEVQTSSGGGAIQTTKSFFKGVKNPNGQTARLSLITQAGKIEVNE